MILQCYYCRGPIFGFTDDAGETCEYDGECINDEHPLFHPGEMTDEELLLSEAGELWICDGCAKEMLKRREEEIEESLTQEGGLNHGSA